ncbi:hypothetical protein KUTeg_003286 [Tegillarca granosa]|uniref:Flavin reductase like domain-containing protein n=1 Tax=Tegillarca granosa TaxID=220873 RepID=A0ABQ9FR64_TEGGR|nr:hypothetical protein KUTeg_003286 [Tegillarca granosa]
MHVYKRCVIARESDAAKVKDKNDIEESNLKNKFKHLMRKVPQTVVVVTTAEYDILHNMWHKRGMTCTSFTSVSFTPPIISFCIKNPSQMHEILLRTQHFAVHVLGKNQGTPLIHGCSALMQCKAHSVNMVGDHHVWYGRVIDADINEEPVDPLLYFVRSFRSVGDEIFIQAFEDATLPYEDWTHKAHLRMAWTYITEHGKEGATPHIKEGIKRFNEQNKDKVCKTRFEATSKLIIDKL